MTPQEKLKLLNDIGAHLQTRYTTQQINQLLRGYGINFQEEQMPSSKRTYVSNILSHQGNYRVWNIAKDLGIPVPSDPYGPSPNPTTSYKQEKLEPFQPMPDTKNRKIFLSHAAKDKDIADELLDILHAVGIDRDRIFYSSAHGYGITLGENFIQRLKEELTGEITTIFLLSNNFYNSAMCMCEMGATWVMAHKHIPILIPPFDFTKVRGVFPNTQGMHINDRTAFSELAELLRKDFDMGPFKHTHWERDRNRICDRIDKALKLHDSVD